MDAILSDNLDDNIINDINLILKDYANHSCEVTDPLQLLQYEKSLNSILPFSDTILYVFFGGSGDVLGEIHDLHHGKYPNTELAIKMYEDIIIKINYLDSGLFFNSNGEKFHLTIDYLGNIKIIQKETTVFSFRSYSPTFNSFDHKLRQHHRGDDIEVFHPGPWLIDFFISFAKFTSRLSKHLKSKS